MDSWVRYEQQAKESEQAELAKTIIAKVLGNLKDEKTQRDILNGAIADIERKSKFLSSPVCQVTDRFIAELVKTKAI